MTLVHVSILAKD